LGDAIDCVQMMPRGQIRDESLGHIIAALAKNGRSIEATDLLNRVFDKSGDFLTCIYGDNSPNIYYQFAINILIKNNKITEAIQIASLGSDNDEIKILLGYVFSSVKEDHQFEKVFEITNRLFVSERRRKDFIRQFFSTAVQNNEIVNVIKFILNHLELPRTWPMIKKQLILSNDLEGWVGYTETVRKEIDLLPDGLCKSRVINRIARLINHSETMGKTYEKVLSLVRKIPIKTIRIKTLQLIIDETNSKIRAKEEEIEKLKRGRSADTIEYILNGLLLDGLSNLTKRLEFFENELKQYQTNSTSNVGTTSA
jgi:hypothetical protein